MSTLTTLSPAEGQQLFRCYLAAMSRPGTVQRADVEVTPAVAAPLLTLADLMSPVAALDTRTPDATGELIAEIARVTGAPLVEPAQARFALALTEPTADSLGCVRTATASDPHTACLVVQRVEKLGPDGEVTLTLTGPGVEERCDLGVTGLSAEFFATRAELCADFPAGIDLLLVTDAGEVAAIPRTATVEGAQR